MCKNVRLSGSGRIGPGAGRAGYANPSPTGPIQFGDRYQRTRRHGGSAHAVSRNQQVVSGGGDDDGGGGGGGGTAAGRSIAARDRRRKDVRGRAARERNKFV